LDNAYNNYAFIQVGDNDNCYIQLKGHLGVDFIYVDENGNVYNENTRPYQYRNQNDTRIAKLQYKIDELQKELDCIRNND